jgi:hypothetical protein
VKNRRFATATIKRRLICAVLGSWRRPAVADRPYLRRRHSHLGQRSPIAYENALAEKPATLLLAA